MKLSILIPTYNYNARALVRDLHRLAQEEGVEAEIIIGDDASTNDTEWFSEVEQLSHVSVMHETVNQGRAIIRNHLADASHGEWLWFIDADAEVPPTFSLSIALHTGTMAPAVCGGLYHPDAKPSPEKMLRYKYEMDADTKRSADQRSEFPHHHITTFNLLVRHDVFLQIRFNEHCDKYGYEDVMFGLELERHRIAVLHIEDPLIHNGLDTNSEFLEKTEIAMHSLHKISSSIPSDGNGIVRVARHLQETKMTWAVRLLFKLLRRPIRKNLLGSHPLLPLFQFYKLGYYLCLK